MVLGAGLTLREGTCRLAFLEGCGGVCWDAIVGKRAICLYFLVLLSPRDDDVACVMTNVDHVAKIAVGVVVVVTLLFLLEIGDALAPERPFLIKQATTLVKVFCCWLLF